MPAWPSGGNDGEHTVTFRATDADGIAEEPQRVQVRIDTVPPKTTVVGHRDGWLKSDVMLRFSAHDDCSGVAGTAYRVDDAPWVQRNDLLLRAEPDGSNDGVHTVAYRSWDVAGNVEPEQSVTVSIDVRPPVTTASGAGDDTWHAEDVHIRFTAEDSGSGVTATEHRVDEGPWITGDTATVRAPADGSNDGEHVVRYRSSDGAGNVEPERTGLVRIDATPPVTTVEDGAKARRDDPKTVRFEATDAHSGVARTEFRLDGGPWTEGTIMALPEGPAGIHTVEFRSVDGAGNIEAPRKLIMETLDGEAPHMRTAPGPSSARRRQADGRRRRLVLLLVVITVAAAAGTGFLALWHEPSSHAAQKQAVIDGIMAIQRKVDAYAANYGLPGEPQVNAAGLSQGSAWPTNPYTRDPMRPGKNPGDYTYEIVDPNRYRLVGYGDDAQAVVITYGP